MAEEHKQKSHEQESPVVAGEGSVETQDRGLFDLLGKKEEKKPQEEQVIASEFENKVQISEAPTPAPVKVEEPKKEKEEKEPGLFKKLGRSDSSSSSSSDEEEVGEGGEEKKKKKEKKGVKETLGEKFSGEDKHEDGTVPVEVVHHEETQSEEKKRFLDKIKDKLPGQQKKGDEVPASTPALAHESSATVAAEAPSHEADAKEKKGFLDKIKEKIPGYHSKTEEEKEKEKESN